MLLDLGDISKMVELIRNYPEVTLSIFSFVLLINCSMIIYKIIKK